MNVQPRGHSNTWPCLCPLRPISQLHLYRAWLYPLAQSKWNAFPTHWLLLIEAQWEPNPHPYLHVPSFLPWWLNSLHSCSFCCKFRPAVSLPTTTVQIFPHLSTHPIGHNIDFLRSYTYSLATSPQNSIRVGFILGLLHCRLILSLLLFSWCFLPVDITFCLLPNLSSHCQPRTLNFNQNI